MEERSGFGYFLLGLGIGVAAGILWAPRSGEETRQIIADRAGEGADYLKNRAQEGSEYVRQRTEGLRQTAGDLYEKGRSGVQRQKDAINTAKDTLSAAVEAGKQAYRDAVSDVKAAAAGSGSSTTGTRPGSSGTPETV